MIQIYAPNNTDYSKNGTVLLPTSCELNMEINSTWSVELINPLDDRFKNIVENAVLSVPTPYGQNLFRITQIDKTDTEITAIAVPVFLDAQNDTFIYDQRPTDKNGQEALDILMNGTKYTGHSDIDTINTAYYVMKNLIECIASDDENSFLNRWGGEIRFDDYDIYINERLGADNGARVEFGFNLSSIQESIDMTNVVTKIIPVAYNGHTLPNQETVNSPNNLNKYPLYYIRQIQYDDIKLAEDAMEDDEENGITVCDTLTELYQALRTRAAKEFDNGIDLPSITYQVDMVDLEKTLEYAEYKDLVKVNLGDTVHVRHRRLDIETEARIIALTYDCIKQKRTSLTIGDFVSNYFDKNSDITSSASQVINTSNNTLLANKIEGVINLLNTSLRAQKDIAQKQDVRAILFEDLDEESPMFGALCLGTQGLQISKERNEANTDWVWGTAINFESIIADYIITGILSDRQGKNSWNLDTGVLTTKDIVVENGTFSGDIKGSAITGGTINGTTINGATIVASLQKTYHIKSGDPEKIRNTIMGTYTPTSEEFSNWDIDCSGYISARDYLFANNILNGSMSGTFDMSLILGDVDGILSLKCVSTNGSRTFESLLNPASLTIDSVYTTRVEANNMEITQGDLVILDENKIAGGYITINTAGGTPVFEIIGNNFSEVTDSLHSIPIRINAALNPVLFVASYYEFNCAAGQGFEIYGNPCFIDFHNDYSKSDYTHRLLCNTGGGITAYPSISSASDIRLKKDIQMVDEKYLNVLNDLEIKTYRYKKNDKNLNIGLIAQDVLEIFKKHGIEDYPIADQDEIEGMYSIDYSQITSLLVYGYQKQRKRIEELEARLKKLEEAMNQ